MDDPAAKRKKRTVPKSLQMILKFDAFATDIFCQIAERVLNPVKYRVHYKALEISCHTLPWFALSLASIWILWNEALIQSQFNFLIGLIIDVITISLLKAFIRRRRPVGGNHSDMFLTISMDQYSFPSGHVSRAVFITCFFFMLYPSSYLIHMLLLCWTIAVSVSRVLLRRHHILDVLGGVLLGLTEAWLLSAIWISKSTSLWILTSLSDEAMNLEGLHDNHAEDLDL